MRLTRHSDYSLRVLMYLAAFPDRLATAEQIAAAYDISHHHIMKVVQRLARLGLIETLRGRNGGIRLAQPPEKITIGEVVRATEEDFDLVECFRTKTACCITPVCRLQTALRDALGAYLGVLDEWTLDELTISSSGLADSLRQHLAVSPG
ncbi:MULTISPECIES: RrF2 family transcriptional regulator [Methyloceanibacter]|uniref:RrF2 family transcriptional regulator n=1 Tax=Methyloceanibacter TaxID=1484898 RepID=UPI0005EE9B93|nr:MULTISPECIES: Rrf2 family transcriptional regulator [Methyloceanibacter]